MREKEYVYTKQIMKNLPTELIRHILKFGNKGMILKHNQLISLQKLLQIQVPVQDKNYRKSFVYSKMQTSSFWLEYHWFLISNKFRIVLRHYETEKQIVSEFQIWSSQDRQSYTLTTYPNLYFNIRQQMDEFNPLRLATRGHTGSHIVETFHIN